MSPNQQAALIAAALLLASANGARAGTVTETTSTPIVFSGNGSETFNFPDLANANELVSISGGSVSTGEGSVEIILNYAGGATQTLYENDEIFETVDLSTIASVPFPEGTINGVTFTIEGAGPPSVSVPAGTEFVFQTTGVPEPATWAMLIVGLGMLGLGLRMGLGKRPAASF